MKPLTAFLPEITPHAAGCPSIVAQNAVRNAAIEFLKKTGIRQQAIDIPLKAGVPTYDAVGLDGMVTSTFIRGMILGVYPVKAKAPGELDKDSPSWRVQTAQYPVFAFMENRKLTVTPTPTEDSILSATFSVTLSRAVTEVDDYLYEDWLENIAWGALARLLILPNNEWSNPDLAQFYKDKFVEGISNAELDRATGSTNGALTAYSPKPFGF